jgi:hypothetical protein
MKPKLGGTRFTAHVGCVLIAGMLMGTAGAQAAVAPCVTPDNPPGCKNTPRAERTPGPPPTTPDTPPSPPQQTTPLPPGQKVPQSGVVQPPATGDEQMEKPAPPTGPNSMPVIPPGHTTPPP